jgi:hypothetical protein
MLITRRVQLLYQELATLPDHVFNNADFGEGLVDNFLVFWVVFHCFLFSPFAFVHWIVGTTPLVDRNRTGEKKLCFRYDSFCRPLFGDLLCDLRASDGVKTNSKSSTIQKLKVQNQSLLQIQGMAQKDPLQVHNR